MIRQIGKSMQRPLSIRGMCSSFTAQALKYESYGEPCDVVKIVEETIEAPKNKEVVVKILLAPINPADINTIQGFYLNLHFYISYYYSQFHQGSIHRSLLFRLSVEMRASEKLLLSVIKCKPLKLATGLFPMPKT